MAAPVGSADYYPWFDWLRIVLAVTVMLSHEGLLDGWLQAGNFAVQVFFALSGWLIGNILLETPRSGLPRFYFNRALRIWCPYFLALALLLALALVRDNPNLRWAEFVFYKITFVYNLFGPPQLAEHRLDMPLSGTGNHFWSVNAEEQFYLLAPLLLVLAPPRVGRNVITWLLIAVFTWITGLYSSIVLGVLAAVAAHTFGSFQTKSIARAGAAVAVVSCAAAMVFGARYELAAPICSVAIVLLLAVQGRQHRWGKVAGGMSYPLYLNHWMGFFFFHGLFKHLGLLDHPVASIARHTLSMGCSLGIAALLYLNFDRRILANRARFYTLPRARVLTVVAYTTVIVGVLVGVGLEFVRNR